MEQTFEPLNWTVDRIIPEGCVVLAGRPKIGKSWFALQLALAVATGGKALEHTPVQQNCVLYMALEDTERRLQSRVKQLLGDGPVPQELRLATNWPTIDEGGAEALDQFLTCYPEHKLVIIDTFRKIKSRKRGGEFDTLTKLSDIAHKFGICLLIIHHTRKADAEDAFDTVSGSTETASVADAMLVLKRSRYSSYSELNVTGRDIEEKKLALKFYSDTLRWELIGEADKVLMSETRKEIIQVLRKADTSMTPKEIADCLDKKPATVRKAISRMLRDKQIDTSYSPGRYLVFNDKDTLAKEKAFNEAEEKKFFYVDPLRKLVSAMREKGIKRAFEEMGFGAVSLTAPETYKHLM